MNKPESILEIRTLGRFSISVDDTLVALEWPDEALKEFFCSLLSPLDLYITWDRICRSMWGEPATRTGRRRLEEAFIKPLGKFLIRELGFNPLISGNEGIRIDQLHITVDALEFHRTVVEGLSLLSLGNHASALKKLRRAHALYAGTYLPGIQGKIIENTRNDLESLYRSAVMNALPVIETQGCSGRNRRPETGRHLKVAQRPLHTLLYDQEESLYQGYRIF
ncbi:MAG: hypothetical protein IPQ16_03775 [Geobacteraceae bacterium]|nr:hypothetical protein [Geobacteraceae bacterium]